MEQAVETAAPRAAKYNVDLQISVAEGLPRVVGDTQDLYRVFLNLIGNAIEACMEVGGVVAVALVTTGKRRSSETELRCQNAFSDASSAAELICIASPNCAASLFGLRLTTR